MIHIEISVDVQLVHITYLFGRCESQSCRNPGAYPSGYQTLGTLPQHGIEGLPTIGFIGFYPNIESIVAQLIYLLFKSTLCLSNR